MKKEIMRNVTQIGGFLFGCIITGMILGLAIITLRNDPKLLPQLVLMEASSKNEETESTEQEQPVEFVTVEELIAEHTICNGNSSEDRNTNMAIAAQMINGQTDGYVMQPGEFFSWFSVVGETTAEKGFKKAPVVEQGKTVQGLGGGVCQVSTTINSAIVKLGIPTNAKEHSKSPKYLSRSDAEATVSFDSGIDFSFQNTLEYPLRIQVETNGGISTVKVFATKVVAK